MDLQQLPEGCIANIVSLTTPEDACRLSVLSKNFKSAAESDAVWDKFLPPETPTILSQSGESGLLAAKSKKELYLALCNKPVLINDGKLSFSLDKWSGKKCYMISARELGIVWADTPEYWRWTSHPESRFQEVAELLHVCWLEIHGKLETRLLSPSTLYKAYLVFKFTPEAYGFKHLPAEVTIGLEGGERSKQTVFFPNEGEMNDFEREMDYSEEEMDFSEVESDDAEGEINDSRGLSEDAEGESKDAKGESDETEGESDGAKGETRDAEVPEVVFNDDRYQREDRDQRERSGWSEIELGEFFCEGGDDGLLKMHCLANGGGHWKSGLIVQGIEVRPKRKY
ncbi:putative F-box protein PP2-B12 [Rosa sericea]